MSTIDLSSKKPPYKRTDFRYEIWLKERKALRSRAKKQSFRVEMAPPNLPRNLACNAVSVDTTKARSTTDVVRLCLRELGWREFPFGRRDGATSDIYWHSAHYGECQELTGGKVNKFPGMVEVVRKVNLGRSLDLLHQLFPEDFSFHPRSWFLPQQFAEFCDAARRAVERNGGKKQVYIVKPDEGSQGDGIYLIQDPRDYNFTPDKSHIVQEYLARPLLLENLKFDFRIYVVVASIEPLEVYICKEGLARFCTVPYQYPTNRNIHDTYMHLTNYSLNKYSGTYLHTESDDDGSKRTLRRVFRRLSLMRYDTALIWEDIRRLVVKTIIAITPELKVEYRGQVPQGKPGPTCFQILGFDVMLTESGKPFLLEVNANPSLRIDYENELAPGISEYIFSPVDEEIKRPLVMDTLILVAPRHKSTARFCKRLKTKSTDKQQPVAMTTTTTVPSPDNKENVPTSGDPPTAKQPVSTAALDDESEEEYEMLPPHRGYGSLEQIFPAIYGEDYAEFRVLERTADIFLECLGCRGYLRMGQTAFRNFTRRCKITGTATSCLTNAGLDIMYIDLQRRWEHVNHDRMVSTVGLCYQAFIEAFFFIAKKKYPSEPTIEAVLKLLDFCEKNLAEDREQEKRPRGGAGGEPMFPKLPGNPKTPEEQAQVMKKIYGTQRRRKLTSGSSAQIIDCRKPPPSGGKAPSYRAGPPRAGSAKAGGCTVPGGPPQPQPPPPGSGKGRRGSREAAKHSSTEQ